MIYSASSIIPGNVSFSNPTPGQTLPIEDVAAQWNQAANAAGYWVDYIGADDSYYGAFTTETSWTIPGGSLQAGEAFFSVTALSDSLGLTDGTTETPQNDTEEAATDDDSDWMYETSKWVSFTSNEITAQIADETLTDAARAPKPASGRIVFLYRKGRLQDQA